MDKFNDDISYAASESGVNSSHGGFATEEVQEVIAKAESKAVFRFKLLLLAILSLSTAGAASAVYYYTRYTEISAFERAFEDESAKVFESIGSTFDLTLEATDAFIVSMISYARNTNSTWPFVTIPDHAVRTSKIQSLSKTSLITQYHVVSEEQRSEWEKYSLENNYWVEEGIEIQKNDETYEGKLVEEYYTVGHIHNDYGQPVENRTTYFVKWQNAPVVPVYPPFNWDGNEYSSLVKALPTLLNEHEVVISDVANIADNVDDPKTVKIANDNTKYMRNYIVDEDKAGEPVSDIFYPILSNAVDSVSIPGNSGNVVGIFAMTFFWRHLIKDILPPGSDGVVVVFENKCNESFTYKINGPDVLYLGPSDLHETKYDDFVLASNLIDLDAFATKDSIYTGLPVTEGLCSYALRVYPSTDMENLFTTSNPIYFTVTAVFIFAFTSIVFLMYDCLVERRQEKVMNKAVHSSAIVSSLFPSNVRDRLFNNQETEKSPESKQDSPFEASKLRLKTFLHDTKSNETAPDKKSDKASNPIADLFPDCTVLFSDIAGFTSWSSIREPTQVFTLLETIYASFDATAKRRGVFKVETIGDAYVAVVGLPEPREDHAVVMSKFARDCRDQMVMIAKELELTLGPGTGDLQLRFGLNSGPVTAGVLRGQKSRFQLFGDSVNTAARMETTGRKGRIHVSQSTADLLIMAGKSHWVTKRDEMVEAKGKGKMQTYWVEPINGSNKPAEIVGRLSESSDSDEKTKRLIEWTIEVFSRLICKIIARRKSNEIQGSKSNKRVKYQRKTEDRKSILEEVTDIIELPEVDPAIIACEDVSDCAELDPVVLSQLREYVVTIASRYNDNNFHNFEHASHMGMSLAKLLVRIVPPNQALKTQAYHPDNTFGITSDPLTQFACAFAALIHDVDHPGVPNTQLLKENSPLSITYEGKSIAEQNSVDISWNLFLESRFDTLRAAICPSEAENRQLRQLIVNSVMATDILDKDLMKLRNERWDRAFSESTLEDVARDRVNRKATIVIEHLVQASDIAHTMQHWQVYRKWNEKLFKEMFWAFKGGRGSTDPGKVWYEGELGFFDYYVIPLAKKLKESGVFGMQSDEYLNYALKNREEWECKGRDIVTKMIEKLEKTAR